VYGDLLPGGPDHHALQQAAGDWYSARIRGWMTQLEWGEAAGCDGVLLDADGNHVEVQVLCSERLALNWTRLDRFHGNAFRRRTVSAHVGGRVGDASGSGEARSGSVLNGSVLNVSVYELVTDGE